MSKLSLKNVYKVYPGGVRAVNDFSLEIKDKEFIVFVGPSGCGKSTTLRMIAGLEKITSGQLYIDDVLMNEVESKDRDIAMVFQNYALYPHMTVYQNMAFGLKLRKEDPKEIDERVKKAAKILEIEDLLSRKPKALSGGQRQRVALGRAIVREPKVFLLDEPLSNLDAKLRVQMRTEITKLHKRLETTFIYVTHDQTEAMTMGDRIVVMKDGFIQQVDTPTNLYNAPANLFVATFLGSPQMNILSCSLKMKDNQIEANLNDTAKDKVIFPSKRSMELSDSKYLENSALLGIRPEHVKITSSGIKGTIDVIEQLGDETILYIKIDGYAQDVLSKVVSSSKYHVKDTIHVSFDMNKAHLFDEESGASILGVLTQNRFLSSVDKDAFFLGDQKCAFSQAFKKHLLNRTFVKGGKVYLSFSPLSVSLKDSGEPSISFKGTVAFIEETSEGYDVFISVKGSKQYIFFHEEMDQKAKEGQELTLFIKEKDIAVFDESGERLSIREEAIPNVLTAEFKCVKGQTEVKIGNEKLLFDKMDISDGPHKIELQQEKMRAIFTKKAIKALKVKNEPYDKKKVISCSAYDEDPLGITNAIFVKIPGLDHYATFVIPNNFSVYKMPEFQLYLEDGAIKVLD